MRCSLHPLFICAILLSVSCGEAGRFIYGDTLDQVELSLNDSTLGIHPSLSVMDDPNNPFRFARSGAETKWEIESAGYPVARFYSWATWLATEATGEHQYYTALALRDIYRQGLVPEEKREQVRQLAIRAFHAMLAFFPDAVTYDFSGTVAFPLARDAYQAIVDLEGDPSPWRLVEDIEGEEVVIQ